MPHWACHFSAGKRRRDGVGPILTSPVRHIASSLLFHARKYVLHVFGLCNVATIDSEAGCVVD
jgi:hypothetical protein